MAQASAFVFGDDFGEERRSGGPRRGHDRAALIEAEERGYAAGFVAGQMAQQSSDEGQLIATLRTIGAAMHAFEEQKIRFLSRCEVESIGLAAAIAEVHGQLVRGIDLHVAFTVAARDVLWQFASAPRLVARVPLSQRDAIEERLRALAEEARYSGILCVEPLSDGEADSNFELEWSDGALRYDRNTIRTMLEKEDERFGFSIADE